MGHTYSEVLRNTLLMLYKRLNRIKCSDKYCDIFLYAELLTHLSRNSLQLKNNDNSPGSPQPSFSVKVTLKFVILCNENWGCHKKSHL